MHICTHKLLLYIINIINLYKSESVFIYFVYFEKNLMECNALSDFYLKFHIKLIFMLIETIHVSILVLVPVF